jgi:hypothetical protein
VGFLLLGCADSGSGDQRQFAAVGATLRAAASSRRGRSVPPIRIIKSLARSPSGKAKVCKTFIGGSIPPRASKIENKRGFTQSSRFYFAPLAIGNRISHNCKLLHLLSRRFVGYFFREIEDGPIRKMVISGGLRSLTKRWIPVHAGC